MRTIFRLSLPFLLLLLVFPSVFGYDDLPEKINGEFWTELEPMTIESAQYGPPSREAAVRAMLEEARFVFSGMVYGFSFIYTPPDKTRQVKEVFSLTPLAEIPFGSAQLEVRQTYMEEGKLFAIIDYHLKEYEGYRVAGWDANTFVQLTGIGEGVYFTGPEEKITAHKNSAKSALREYLRELVYNKPKQVKGEFIFAESPRIFAAGGKYVSTVSINLQLDEIKEYTAF